MPPDNFIKRIAGRKASAIPALALAVGAILLLLWLRQGPDADVEMRLPDIDQTSGAAGGLDPAATGKVVSGPGTPSDSTGIWPQFRGPDRNGISHETNALARAAWQRMSSVI